MSDHVERITTHIESLWTPETSTLPQRWSNRTLEGHAIGQGVVSALVLRDWLGGKLVECLRITDRSESLHVYNSLYDGKLIVDMTKRYRRVDEELLVNMRTADPLSLLERYKALHDPYQALGSAMLERLAPEEPRFAVDVSELGIVMAAPNRAAMPPTVS
ncbi:MAG TPA: hypothetical protein VLG11_05200 [Candidatus Saccharimonadales bacterium]|nr:hypothetical protein [Candidatus Saccharimonadales bacterium]